MEHFYCPDTLQEEIFAENLTNLHHWHGGKFLGQ
jgi:hypothetical protein